MKCPACGYENKGEPVVCGMCAAPLGRPAEPPAATTPGPIPAPAAAGDGGGSDGGRRGFSWKMLGLGGIGLGAVVTLGLEFGKDWIWGSVEQGVKERSAAVNCKASLRRLTTGWHVFCQEREDLMEEGPAKMWEAYLAAEEPKYTRCPANDKPYRLVKVKPGRWSYGDWVIADPPGAHPDSGLIHGVAEVGELVTMTEAEFNALQ